MAPRLLSVRRRGFCGLAALAVSLLLAPALRAEVPNLDETLPLGEVRERDIAAGETHAWRVTVAPGTVALLTVEQRSIALVVEARRAADRDLVAATGSGDRWGTEALLLEAPGELRIEIRPQEKSVWPGRYALRLEVLPEREGPRHEALALMSRAGRETLPGTPDSNRQATLSYRQALAAWASLADRPWRAEALTSLAILEADASELPQATPDFLAALTLWRELGRPQREAEAWNGLGVIYLDTQPVAVARETLEKAHSLWSGLGEPFEEAETAGNLCLWELRFGSLSAALACEQKNLMFFQGKGVPGQEAEVFNRLGGISSLQGEPDAALESYGKSLGIWRSLGDPNKEATILSNTAVVHRSLGEWQEALHLYDQARDALGPQGDPALVASLLSNTGVIYNNVGEPERARGFLQEALTLRRKVGDRAGEVVTLNNLGAAARQLGEADQALDWHQQALDLATAQKNAAQQALSHLRLAEVDLDRGDASAAIRHLDAALSVLGERGNRNNRTEILHQKGRALILTGRPQEALAALQEALSGRRAARDRAGEAETLYEKARAERALGRAGEALSDAKAAVNGVEDLRIGVLNADLRASFLATRRHAFSLLIDLLMDRQTADPGKGYDQEAFAISERAHARSLLDVLRSGGARPTSEGAAPLGLLARRNALLRLLSAKIDQRWKQSGERAAALQDEIDAYLEKLDGVEAEILRQDPRFAAFSSPKPVGLQEISAWLEPGTMLLEYSLGEERSFLWTLEGGQIHGAVLPGQKRIEELARQVYEEISRAEAGSARGGKAAADLSEILLSPIWKAAVGPRRLVVVPDGALGLLPFAALLVPDPGRDWKTPGTLKPLLERLEVVAIPSATIFDVQRQRLRRHAQAPKWAAVLADPVFDANDPRLAQRSGALLAAPNRKSAPEARLRGPRTEDPTAELERLPATGREARSIEALAPPGQVWLGLGLDANRDVVLSGKLRDYATLHFATHAVADIRHPELSGLMLSKVDREGHPREGFLGLSDIYALDLDADLVVLAGCRTALGKDVRGEGLIGLARGFFYAGSPRVVASLWRVPDRTTAELMALFYKAMWHDHLPAASALRAAQRSLRREPRFRDPFSWAGFVLQGDWH
jgi:CHAT domain-containing protein/tetratricopeptide (TPR) repeat protein